MDLVDVSESVCVYRIHDDETLLNLILYKTFSCSIARKYHYVIQIADIKNFLEEYVWMH